MEEERKVETVAEDSSSDREVEAVAVPAKRALFNRKKAVKVSLVVFVATVLVVASITLAVLMFPTVYSVKLSRVITADNLIWSDEFDGDTLDARYWNIVDEYDNGGSYNAATMVGVSGGMLNLTLQYNTEKSRWECGAIHTRATIDKVGMYQKYGYIEIRARLLAMRGAWSYAMLLPDGFAETDSVDAKTAGAEIAFMQSPSYPLCVVEQSVHLGGISDNKQTFYNNRFQKQGVSKDIYAEYVTYGVYWNENVYKFYVDGECRWTTDTDDNVSEVASALCLGIGTVGGYNEGLTDWTGGNKLGDNATNLKSIYSVDYVRIYGVYDAGGKIIR